MDYQQLYLNATSKISSLEANLQINKDMLESLILQSKATEEKYKDEVIILNKIISDHHKLHTDEVEDLKDQLNHTKDALEMKEYLLQEKEIKWKEFEDVVVKFAEDHEDLREKLAEIDYLCDEVTSQRKITSVVQENLDLKIKINDLKSQLSEVVSSPTYNEGENDQEENMHYHGEPSSTRNQKMEVLQFLQADEDTQFQSGNMTTKNRHLEPPCKTGFRRSRFGSANIIDGDHSSTTDEAPKNPNWEDNYRTEQKKIDIEVTPFGEEDEKEFGHINESSINLDECPIERSSRPSKLFDDVLDGCLEVLSENLKNSALGELSDDF